MIIDREDIEADIDDLIETVTERARPLLAEHGVTAPGHVADVCHRLIRDRFPALFVGAGAVGDRLAALKAQDPHLFGTTADPRELYRLLVEANSERFDRPSDLKAWVESKVRRAVSIGPDEIRAECYAVRREIEAIRFAEGAAQPGTKAPTRVQP